MTLEELYSNLEAAGFQRQTTPQEPEPVPEPEPAPEPENTVSNEEVLAAIKGLTAALQATAVKTLTFENPPQPKTAEDILGEMLSGSRPENK